VTSLRRVGSHFGDAREFSASYGTSTRAAGKVRIAQGCRPWAALTGASAYIPCVLCAGRDTTDSFGHLLARRMPASADRNGLVTRACGLSHSSVLINIEMSK
jgi:hypothetical protein